MNDMTLLPPPGQPLKHFVSTAPFDPAAAEVMSEQQKRIHMASQWKLMWWKFKRHRLALMSGIILAILYFMILFCEFLAPYDLATRNVDSIYAPPQKVHLFHDGQFVGPFVYGRTMQLNLENLKRDYADNPQDVQKLRFFCRGDAYSFWGFIEGSLHLVCPAEGGQFFLLGTDQLGRDVLSRIIYGARISLTIGLLGVAVSFILGIVIGGIAGYRGGIFDFVCRGAEPAASLWLATDRRVKSASVVALTPYRSSPCGATSRPVPQWRGGRWGRRRCIA